VLSEPLSAGSAVTSLPVALLPAALGAGHRFVLPTGQVARLSDHAGPGAASLPVDPLIPAAAVAAGTALPQQVTITVAKTPTGLTATRSDDAAVVSCTDTTWSGGYVFLRNAGDGVAAVSCSHLTIT
jgi:hypothetical protein